jgi:nucleotide-binding universal stress UspA family protein
MYRRILVPVDGSATATLGLKHAIEMAKEQGARIRLLNVVDQRFLVPVMDDFPADPTPVIESLRGIGRQALADAEKAAQAAGVPFESEMIEGRERHVSEVILNEASDWEADLIVMGTHGRRGMNRLVLGSDAERVLRETPVPLLLIRAAPQASTGGNSTQA